MRFARAAVPLVLATVAACGLDAVGAATNGAVSSGGTDADANGAKDGGESKPTDGGSALPLDGATSPAPILFLEGNTTVQTQTVNLTTDGTTDWIYWGNSPLERKKVAVHPIGNYSSSAYAEYVSDQASKFSWSDGIPTTAATDRNGFIGFGGFAPDVQLVVGATRAKQVFTFYGGGQNSTPTFIAKLGGLSYTKVVNSGSGSSPYSIAVSLVFSSPTPQDLVVHWSWDEDGDMSKFITIKAATLRPY